MAVEACLTLKNKSAGFQIEDKQAEETVRTGATWFRPVFAWAIFSFTLSLKNNLPNISQTEEKRKYGADETCSCR
jgi:hypothetical protein